MPRLLLFPNLYDIMNAKAFIIVDLVSYQKEVYGGYEALGHMIRAIIGKENVIQSITEHWIYAEMIKLPQGYALTFLNDYLFDDIEELCDLKNTRNYPHLNYLTDSVIYFLKEKSLNGQLVYMETDYFGGYGTQAGVFFENGEMKCEPMYGDDTVNHLLRLLGVRKHLLKDEFDTLELYKYRRMD